jgi:S-adenosylmethionine:tRNA ribosyltransferase-isomerase
LGGSVAEGDERGLWWGLCKKFQKLSIGDELTLADNKTKIIIRDKNDESGLLIEFIKSESGIGNPKQDSDSGFRIPDSDFVFSVLDRVGKMPLPPYMNRADEAADRTRYQTVYADPLGSMAAPTAGLHFTNEMLREIEKRGAKIVNITLHVGAGTWMPVKTEDLTKHKMHSEFGVITPEQVAAINSAKRVIAVGTTSLRLLESAARQTTDDRRLTTFHGTTDIFITPGYKFRAVDVLLTNFHLPKSTLFMLVSAFAGVPEMRAAYEHAIAEKYRFFSYGDCCLLFPSCGGVSANADGEDSCH